MRIKRIHLKENIIAFVYWIHLPEQTDMFSVGYIGVTKNSVASRFRQHSSAAKSGSTLVIHKAIRKYSTLVITTIVDGSEEYCYEVEHRLRPSRMLGWNIVEGGGKSPMSGVTGENHPCFGKLCSDATKEKISLANSGEKNGMSKMIGDLNHFFGKTHTEATKAILSAKVVSTETRAKQSKAKIGVRRSEASVEKTAMGNRGKKRTSEQCALMSSRQIGKVVSEATKELLRNIPQPPAWLNIRANKEVWVKATEIYNEYLLEPRYSYLAKRLGVVKSAIYSMTCHFVAGWVPEQDNEYLLWQSEHKTTKESHGT